MRPPPLTLVCIPVGRLTVVGSDMVPVLARDKMTWSGAESDAVWPILLLTTVLHFARPYMGKKKRCWSEGFYFSTFSLKTLSSRYHFFSHSLPLYTTCFTAWERLSFSIVTKRAPKSYIPGLSMQLTTTSLYPNRWSLTIKISLYCLGDACLE